MPSPPPDPGPGSRRDTPVPGASRLGSESAASEKAVAEHASARRRSPVAARYAAISRVSESDVRARVLGMGNVLMGDDALGPWVIEELLAGWQFPEGVRVLDVGTPGLDLTPYLADADTVLLVDTVKADGPPGAIRVYSREQLLSRPPQPRTSPHDPGLTEALFALELEGSAPREVVLVGVVAKSVASGIGLSLPVREAVGRAAAEVVERLAGLGLPPRPRVGAAPASPWWEREVLKL